MAKNKPRVRPSATSGTVLTEGLTSPAPEPIPDFDAGTFEETCKRLSEAGSSLMKRYSAVLALAQDAANCGALRALAELETVHRLPAVVDELSESLRESSSLLDSFRKQCDDWRSGERRSRKARFERLVASMGWNIVGSWPEPVVRGIVFVAVDEAKGKALINGQTLTSPTAERLVKAVAAELDSLTKGLTDAAAFGGQIWAAYRACGASPGEGVSANDLLAKLTWQRQSKQFQRDPRQHAFRGYPMAQFRADLTNYIASGAAAVADSGTQYELEIAGGSFAQDGIFMYFPQSDRLSTCGRLTFKACTTGVKQ
jgi:hypothetical protein